MTGGNAMELERFQRGTRLPAKRWSGSPFRQAKTEKPMNKDRIEGSFEQAKGKAKEIAGKASGDSKLETEGKAQKTAGKIQNTVGGIKDTIKESAE
jgi:uncharacterized protein YjbJ (UPF0337 family)